MRAPTQFTLTSDVPASVGVATFVIADAQGRTQQLAVPSGVSVAHPTDPALGPWQVSYRIDSPAQPTPVFLGETATVADPSATLSVGFALSQGGASAPVLDTQWAPALTAPVSITLTFAMQVQQQTEWGWAAVALSVAGYYRDGPGANLSQCALANWALGRSDCCNRGAAVGAACNQPFSVQNALRHLGNLGAYVPSRLAFDAVQAQLSMRRPIVAIIGWNTGGHHAVVISGFDTLSGKQLITVQDCAGGTTQIVEFGRFPAMGAWVGTCTTVGAT
ncbi:hypothetical protein J5226_23565 [Lysobacter sp. K5869]|uniref:papain-like cysteine protease family protein n=1 Tax=Lysobacter sp. K5869 TaxID=2820808 RepID=UPI001C06278A|nr:papain-like cysteine protease family protein [Lysobacter sp. K5869]QWP76523.1 hypothetical protein J5226_23565 [Lysobacter sp. K5869]